MIIRNASGVTKSFALGLTFSRSLDAGAQATIADTDVRAFADAVDQARLGNIDILKPPAGVDLVAYNTVGAHLLIHLGNGTAQIEVADSITIGGVVFTISAVGASATLDAQSLQEAINANATLTALGIRARDYVNSQGQGGTTRATLFVDLSAMNALELAALTVSKSGTNLSFESVAASLGAQRMVIHQIPATGAATAVGVVIPTGLRDAQSAFVLSKSSAGAVKPIDGVVRLSGSLASVDLSGSADVAATDELLLFAFGY